MTNKLAGREAFLQPIPLQEWEGNIRGLGLVRLQQLSPSNYSKQFTDWLRPDGKTDKDREAVMWSKLVTLCVVDQDNAPILTDEDVDLIEGYPTDVKVKLHRIVLKIHGLSDIEQDDTLGK